MAMTMTLTEAGFAALLCLYAISTSRSADPVALDAMTQHGAAVVRADRMYRSAQASCEAGPASQRDLCFREAKASFLRMMSDAWQSEPPRRLELGRVQDER
jgi:hypothetical protein